MHTTCSSGGTGTDIGPCRDRFSSDRSLPSGTGRDRSAGFVSSRARERSDLETIRPYVSLLVRQGPIGTDFGGHESLYAHAPKGTNPGGTDIGPSGPCHQPVDNSGVAR